MTFKESIKLDFDRLDQAALDQPSLYADAGDKWANAVLQRDRLKEQLSAAKATADAEIRETPSNFGWKSDKNPTEAWVANQISLHPTVKLLESEYIDAQYNVNIASTEKEVLDHRKKAMEILATLYTSSYFVAKSRTGRDYVEVLTEKGSEAQEDVLDKNPRMRRRDG